MNRTIVTVTLLILLMGTSLYAQGFRNLNEGDTVPAFSLVSLAGETIKSSDVRDHPLLVAFFRPGQRQSQNLLNFLKRFYIEMEAADGNIIAVTRNDPSGKMDDAVTYPFPVIWDQEDALYGGFGVVATPSLALIDGEGIIRFSVHMFRESEEDAIRDGLMVIDGQMSMEDWANRREKDSMKHLSSASVDTYLNLATHEQDDGNWEKALELYEKAMSLDSVNSNVWYGYGVTLNQLGNQTNAINAFRSALKVDPALWKAREEIARILMALEQFEEAQIEIDIILDQQPLSVYGRLVQTELLLAENLLPEAQVSISDVVKLAPNNSQAYYVKGRIFEALGKPDSASVAYRRAYELVNTQGHSRK